MTGTVKNYLPVTDEMLRHPDPGDWLMIRRDYQADSYSPLEAITTANVKNLRLEWAWAMNAGASVLGSVLAIVIAIQFGLNATLACGAIAYFFALALSRSLPPKQPAT